MSKNVVTFPRRLEAYDKRLHGSFRFMLTRKLARANSLMTKVLLTPYGNEVEVPEGLGEGPRAKAFISILSQTHRTRMGLMEGKESIDKLQNYFELIRSSLQEFRFSEECSPKAFEATENFLQVASYAYELFTSELLVASYSPLQKLIRENDRELLSVLGGAALNYEKAAIEDLFSFFVQRDDDRQCLLDLFNLRDDFIEAPRLDTLTPYLEAQRAFRGAGCFKGKEALEKLELFEDSLLVEILWHDKTEAAFA